MPVDPTKVVAKPGHGNRLNWASETRDADYRGEPFSNASGCECSPLTRRGTLTHPNGAIRVYNGDVYKSDTAGSEETKLALQKAVRVLEDIPAAQKDWHSGSDSKVLDLVHPSLFPLIYGISKILPIGAPMTTLEDCVKRTCEVDISGDKPKTLTYINNLHPQRHKELYGLMEDLIQASIPLWNLTLVSSDDLFNTPSRVRYDTCLFIGDTRVPEQPEPQGFDSNVLEHESPTDLKEKYGDLPLQAIVKLANIELTPEKPEYASGMWHIEGGLNEAICATAIYYYSSENITRSSLAFRHQASEECFIEDSSELDSQEWLPNVYGLPLDGGDMIQDVGSVETCEGRLITFPNILQHQVQPFKLAYPTKPGHRKIVALFLVDPNIRIISTADVPCQRQDWWAEEALKTSRSSSVRPNLPDSKAGGVYKLPPELQKIVFGGVDDFPIGMDKAKDYREKLMEEFVLKHQQNFVGEIALCEH
ncbi:hypothetical protein EST38_g5895 [Candolleomyces aberdarensis]|uniref:DUF4246 domain-containing protein n=1 Tax=Candolleomyces aberdarensis TaxID=2316362 RepID=A0A4V1Q3W0_9AGAR|nr:hypothetical protein EST38_g5895 [Candolleomyces aberdarensis]